MAKLWFRASIFECKDLKCDIFYFRIGWRNCWIMVIFCNDGHPSKQLSDCKMITNHFWPLFLNLPFFDFFWSNQNYDLLSPKNVIGNQMITKTLLQKKPKLIKLIGTSFKLTGSIFLVVLLPMPGISFCSKATLASFSHLASKVDTWHQTGILGMKTWHPEVSGSYSPCSSLALTQLTYWWS